MDVISAVGLVQSSFGLALQIGKVAKTLNDVADKYKNAKLAIKSLSQNLDILELAWTQIGEWYQGQSEDGLHDDNLTKRVQGFLETGMLVIEALQHDLQSYSIDEIGFSQRTRFIWNETSLQAHGSRIRDQALSMSLFLQVVNLPTPQARAKLLHKSEYQFQKSDESAYSIDSIVPSRMSASIGRRDSYISDQDDDIVPSRRLSFEKGLFMSRVYIRSSMNVMAKELFKARFGSKGKVEASKADQTAKNWEAIRDQIEADSLLARSCEESINDTDTIKSHTDFESKHRSSEEVVRRNHMERNSLLFRRGERSHDTISSQRPDRIRPLSYSGENFIAPSVSGGIFDNELIRSCEQGDSLQVQWLAVRGVDLQAQFKRGSYSGLTAIHVAAINGHIDVVKVLLSCGANIEGETASERRRPLHLAALNGRVSMVQFLIREGAQIDAKDQDRMQPIHDASWSGSVEIFDTLVEAGATVNCLDSSGNQPLHWAAINCLDSFGNQPLQWAAVHLNESRQFNAISHGSVERKLELAKLILNRGAAVNVTNHTGWSPLYLAIRSGNRQLSRLLLEADSHILISSDRLLADIQVRWKHSSTTPSYTLDIANRVFEGRRRALRLELSLCHQGYFTESAMDSACKAVTDWVLEMKC